MDCRLLQKPYIELLYLAKTGEIGGIVILMEWKQKITEIH